MIDARAVATPDDVETPSARAAYLHPGRVLAPEAPGLITTILGSCVSVCLWDGIAGVGGMNHFLLPEPLAGVSSPRFAAPAFEDLRRELVLRGARPSRLRAKLFGGAVLSAAMLSDSIGARNVEAARRLLCAAAIPVLAEDVGGRHGRKLVFETHTGRAWVRALQSL